MVDEKKTPPPPITPPGRTGAEQATIDELPGGEPVVELTIWQSPFVQSVMPFLTSLLVHVAIIVLGFATLQVGAKMAKKVTEQYTVPESADLDDQDGNIAHPGLGGDPTRDAFQDKDMTVPPDSQGINDKAGKDLVGTLQGAAGDTSDSVIGTGGGAAMFGKGTGTGIGNGTGDGGPMAPFGIPGGGGGVGVRFGNVKGVASRIVFVCDATGSMMEQFDLLRAELSRTLSKLNQRQFVNVVFMQESAKPPIDPNLLIASPENKRKLLDFVDGYTCRGPTDPIPALKTAFAMNPQLVYFLCDPSDFPEPAKTIELCKSMSTNGGKKCKIVTIAFENHDEEGEKTLKQIAADSGGQFKFITSQDLER